MSSRRCPLQPASAVAILAIDWLLYLVTAMTELALLDRTILYAAAFAGVVVCLVEHSSFNRSPWHALARGGVAAAAVGIPGVVVGSSLGVSALLWCLASWLASGVHKQRAERPDSQNGGRPSS